MLFSFAANGHSVTQTTALGACLKADNGFDSAIQNMNFSYAPAATNPITSNATIYYMCSPHCGLGMVGNITIAKQGGTPNGAAAVAPGAPVLALAAALTALVAVFMH
jgi:hypothetical protein